LGAEDPVRVLSLKMTMTAEQCEAIRQVADGLIAKGYPRREAVRLACEASLRVVRKPTGMGQEPSLILSSEEGPNGIVAEVRSKVSPWLWVLSIISFGMALTNTRRISKMFGDWKRRRKPA
jgi:hypothetical protein